MPNNPDSQFAFRHNKLAEFYDKNYGRDRRHQVAKSDLERYRFLSEKSMPKLSKQEAIALYSALNGANTSHVEMLPILQQSIISELLEDGQIDLAHRVKDWSLVEWFAVVDGGDRVGGGKYQVEDLVQELRRVGLCSKD